MAHAVVATSRESVRTTIRERPSLNTSRKNATSSGLFSSGVGWGVPGSCKAAFPTAAPAPAPASPSNAAAPKPSAKTAPIPGTSTIAAATPADIPTAPPMKPPVYAPSCLPTVLASFSERVRKTIACSGTLLCNNSFTASSARSLEAKTPMAVSIVTFLDLQSHPQQQKQVQPKHIHKMPVVRGHIERAPPQSEPLEPANHVRQPGQPSEHMDRVNPGKYVEERTARVGGKEESFRFQF